MYLLTFIIFMVCLIAPIISPALYRKVPLNYILLIVFTISYSWWIAWYTILYTKASVLVALFLTVVMVLCLTIYAFYTKKNFTTLGGFLFTALILLIFSFFVVYYLRILKQFLIHYNRNNIHTIQEFYKILVAFQTSLFNNLIFLN